MDVSLQIQTQQHKAGLFPVERAQVWLFFLIIIIYVQWALGINCTALCIESLVDTIYSSPGQGTIEDDQDLLQPRPGGQILPPPS